jgi:hypothetical protein
MRKFATKSGKYRCIKMRKFGWDMGKLFGDCCWAVGWSGGEYWMNFILGSGRSLSEVRLEFIQHLVCGLSLCWRMWFGLFLETRIPGLRFAFFGIQGLTERRGFEILFCTHTPYRHQSMSTSVLIRSPGQEHPWVMIASCPAAYSCPFLHYLSTTNLDGVKDLEPLRCGGGQSPRACSDRSWLCKDYHGAWGEWCRW